MGYAITPARSCTAIALTLCRMNRFEIDFNVFTCHCRGIGGALTLVSAPFGPVANLEPHPTAPYSKRSRRASFIPENTSAYIYENQSQLLWSNL
jgi:hypothetical protein